MRISYFYAEDGYTERGEKIPDIPVVYLLLRFGRYRARGPAIIDTGFDGGVYANIEIARMFEGVEPVDKVLLENPLYGASEFEVYVAEAYLYQGTSNVYLGKVRVYIPTEPELLTGEVLLGREVLNSRVRVLTLDMQERKVMLEL